MREQQLSEVSKNRFSGHIPDAECSEKMRSIRKAVRELALQIEILVPEGRERATALTHLEFVMMSANGGIVRSFPIDEREIV